MNKFTHKQFSRGAALLTFVLLFLAASIILVYGIGKGVYDDVVQYRLNEESKATFFAAESGVEDAVYRHRQGHSYANTEAFTLGGVDVSTVRTFDVDRFIFNTTANTPSVFRKEYVELVLGNGASFSFGLQSDTGGIVMENTSSVRGNIYSNGTVEGTGGGSGNVVSGGIISAGPTGHVEGVHATGSVWAHTIVDSIIDEDARCDSIDDSTVGGFLYCNTVTATTPNPADFAGPADQATSSLPVSDDTIDGWKADALAGGVIASTDPRCAGGTWTIDASTTTGPIKIECDVLVDKSATTWTLGGPIWIEGNLSTKSGPTIEIDPSEPTLVGKSIQIIVDNESDRVTSSQVVLQNSATFNGSGVGSYILLISQNEDEELGGSEVAIESRQSAEGKVLLYAGHGEILIEQSGEFVGVAALLIRLRNSAEIIYEVGAVSLEFPSGPGGGYVVSDWRETQ